MSSWHNQHHGPKYNPQKTKGADPPLLSLSLSCNYIFCLIAIASCQASPGLALTVAFMDSVFENRRLKDKKVAKRMNALNIDSMSRAKEPVRRLTTLQAHQMRAADFRSKHEYDPNLEKAIQEFDKKLVEREKAMQESADSAVASTEGSHQTSADASMPLESRQTAPL